jgi:MFS family permease
MMPLLSDLYGSGADGGSQGFAYGVYNTLFSLGLALGPFLGGLAITYLSFPFAFYGQAVLLCVAGLLCFAFITAVRRKKQAAPRA